MEFHLKIEYKELENDITSFACFQHLNYQEISTFWKLQLNKALLWQ